MDIIIVLIIIYVVYKKSNSSENAKRKKYEQAKKSYAEDCKKFDNITSLNDEKYPNKTIVQNDAIKYSSDDMGGEPIKEYEGFFRKLSKKELK